MQLADNSGGGAPTATCSRCGAVAVGPCARCRLPVCGDCCVLTEGGAKVYAICLACEDRGGRSLKRAWLGFIGWIAAPVLLLLIVVILIEVFSRR
jgi:hypothetical protein